MRFIRRWEEDGKRGGDRVRCCAPAGVDAPAVLRLPSAASRAPIHAAAPPVCNLQPPHSSINFPSAQTHTHEVTPSHSPSASLLSCTQVPPAPSSSPSAPAAPAMSPFRLHPSSSVFLLASTFALCLSLSLAQSYVPNPLPQTACTSGSLVRWGDATPTFQGLSGLGGYTAAFPFYTYALLINGSDYGALISQLQLGLQDNSQLTTPAHLRLGVYLLTGDPFSPTGQLLAQSSEVTVFASGPAILYVNLPTPLALVEGYQYALAVLADVSLNLGWASPDAVNGAYVYTGGYANGLATALPVNTEIDLFLWQVGVAPPAIAAVGCWDPTSFTNSTTRSYYLCINVFQFARSPSTSDVTQVAQSWQVQASGLITVDPTQSSSTAMGTGYRVTGLTALVSVASGPLYYFLPLVTLSSFSTTLGSSLSSGASNLLYTANSSNAVASTVVDVKGLSFLHGGGSSSVLQFVGGTYSFTQPGVQGVTGVANSQVTLTPVTGAGFIAPTCSAGPLPYTPDPVVSCTSMQTAVQFGDADLRDVDTVTFDGLEAVEFWSANVLTFRPIYVPQTSTSITTLQAAVMPSTAAVLHLRMGLYANNGTAALPSMLLLAMSAEVTLTAPTSYFVVSANVPTPITVNAGLYYVAVWFDTPVEGFQTTFANGGAYSFSSIPYGAVSPSGALPSQLSPTSSSVAWPAGAAGCANDGGQPVQLYVCAVVQTSVDTYRYWGQLTVSGRSYNDSFGTFRAIQAANMVTSNADLTESTGPYVLGSWQQTATNLLYDPRTTPAGQMFDSVGLNLVTSVVDFIGSSISAVAIASSSTQPTSQAVYTLAQSTYGEDVVVGATLYSSVTVLPYTDALFNNGSSTCIAPNLTPPANAVTPPSVGLGSACTALGSISGVYGDSAIAHFGNNQEGHTIPANTVYTAPLTVPGTFTLNQIAVDLLNTTLLNATINFQVGVYSPSGALLAKSAGTSVYQIVSQQVVVSMPATTLTAGTYRLAILSDHALPIATSRTATSGILSGQTFAAGLPSSFAQTGTDGAVPLVAAGCSAATHSFCAHVEYYTPGTVTSYIYVGLLQANGSTGTDATYGAYAQVSTGTGHLAVYTTSSQGQPQYLQALAFAGFDDFVLNGTARLYTATTASAAVDTTGLTFASVATGASYQLRYSAASKQVVDGAASSAAAPILSSMTVTPIAQGIPSCGVYDQPKVTIPAAPTSAPSCAANQSPVMYGDDVWSDFALDAQGEGFNGGFVDAMLYTSSAVSWSNLTQVALGVSPNPNWVGHIRFALYNPDLTFQQDLGLLTYINTDYGVLSMQLPRPLLLPPNTTFILGFWMDVVTFMPIGSQMGEPCALVGGWSATGAWPAKLLSGTDCNDNWSAQALLGCTVPAPLPSPSSSATPLSAGRAATSPATAAGSATSAASVPSATSPAVAVAPSSTTPPAAATSTQSQPLAPSSSSGSGFAGACSPASSSGSSLSNGAIAGIVIGCVVGTNLLTLIAFALCCGMGGRAGGAKSSGKQAGSENSEVRSSRDPSNVEMGGRLESPPMSPASGSLHP